MCIRDRVYVAWSASNRSPLIRVPASRGVGTRIELRNPDPSANPYLTLALCLAAGLDGIRRGLKPPCSTDENIFELTEDEREARGDVYKRQGQALPLEGKPLAEATEVLRQHKRGKYPIGK